MLYLVHQQVILCLLYLQSISWIHHFSPSHYHHPSLSQSYFLPGLLQGPSNWSFLCCVCLLTVSLPASIHCGAFKTLINLLTSQLQTLSSRAVTWSGSCWLPQFPPGSCSRPLALVGWDLTHLWAFHLILLPGMYFLPLTHSCASGLREVICQLPSLPSYLLHWMFKNLWLSLFFGFSLLEYKLCDASFLTCSPVCPKPRA